MLKGKYYVEVSLLKKGFIVLFTLVIEALVIWLLSIILNWTFIDTVFLGGLFIFGGAWFYHFVISPKSNEYDATVEYKNVQDMESLKPFLFIKSPITWGLSLFLIGSFIITIIEYYSLS